MTNDPMNTFGGYGVMEVANMQDLLRFICENGYEHHVSVNPANVAAPLKEAMTKYMGWSVYRHS